MGIFRKKHADELSKSIKNIFGFRPGNIFLYELAFMHKSAHVERNGHEISNERLEYLGDAVISVIVADYLFKKFPFADEGVLTEMRSRVVSRNSLNKIAEKLGVGRLVTMSRVPANNAYTGNALEAFFGAVYLDKGYGFAQNLLVSFIFGRRIDADAIISTETNFKSKLIEFCQKERLNLEFSIVDEIQTGRKRQYVCEARIDGEARSRGIDYSIKGAEQNAAEKALESLRNGAE
ncbi:MAG: ribonuclease III [Bacteroidales bacterium]|nr:ribonuclease III [Bacteroidales bacterium]HPB01458.1 ribonuclease III [Bacteroidales bacterium]HPE99144.1 ribonuclease III [Bacteroidales bacterium]